MEKIYYKFPFPLKKRRKIWEEIEGGPLPFESWWTAREKAAAFPSEAELPEEKALALKKKFGGEVVKQMFDNDGYFEREVKYMGGKDND